MLKWLKSLFGFGGRKDNEEVVENDVVYDDLTVEVTYTHPRHRLPSARGPKPRRTPKAPAPAPVPRVSADDIRSWISSVREYDSLSSALRL